MKQTLIYVNHVDLGTVHQHLSDNRKIKAIKHLRNTGRILDTSKDCGYRPPGLKEAKHACDAITSPEYASSAEALVAPAWRVNSFKVEGPMGEVIEVDLETLQMHFLTQLPTLGLEHTDRLLSLVRFIKQWQGEPTPLSTSDANEEVVT